MFIIVITTICSSPVLVAATQPCLSAAFAGSPQKEPQQ